MARRLEPQFKAASELSEDDIRGLVETGRRQAALMNQLQTALENGDEAQALALARQMVALERK